MDDRAVERTPRPWIPLLAALGLFIGLGGLIYWQWNTLQEREREDSQHRFALEAQDIGMRSIAGSLSGNTGRRLVALPEPRAVGRFSSRAEPS